MNITSKENIKESILNRVSEIMNKSSKFPLDIKINIEWNFDEAPICTYEIKEYVPLKGAHYE